MITENNGRGFLYTYSGKIGYPGGAPTLLDTAVSLSREGRFAGAGLRFFPVALHTFVVCDLLPSSLRFDGLFHDSPEVITGDTPKPAKTDEIERFEKNLLKANYYYHGIAEPTEEQRLQVKEADRRAMRGEVYTVGNHALQEFYERDEEAETIIMYYVGKYSYSDMLDAGGMVPLEFMRRYWLYRSMLDEHRIITKKGE